MTESLFKDEKYLDFRKLFGQVEWKRATLDQLVKDFRLAGYDEPAVNEDQEFETVVGQIVVIIEEHQKDSLELDNLIYRIDLPPSIHPSALERRDLATLFLFRCFQKVWLRKQYQSGSAKDESDPGKKQLKP